MVAEKSLSARTSTLAIWLSVQSFLASALLRLLASSWSFVVIGSRPQPPAVIAFWHDEMLPVWKFFAQKQSEKQCSTQMVALVSKSHDGAILARLLRDWGYHLVRASSSSGGAEAVQILIEMLQQPNPNALVCITPDGPRGKRHVMKRGAAMIAAHASVPLYLCRIEASGTRLRRSWDKMLFPGIFARIVIRFAEPLYVEPQEFSSESIQQIENQLSNLPFMR